MAPNVYTYSGAITACEKGRQWQRALELFEEMQQWSIWPDTITYGALVSACEKGHPWQRALEV